MANDPKANAGQNPNSANAGQNDPKAQNAANSTQDRLVGEKAVIEANANPPDRKAETADAHGRNPATIDAHSLVSALRAAVGAPTQDVAPPPSSEIRPGGKFRIGKRLVDCDGEPINDDDDKAEGNKSESPARK